MSGKDLRDTVGLLAVVASLVFVGIEIRQNTVTSRAAAYQTLGIAMADTYAGLAHDRGLLEAMSGESRGLSTGDWEQAAMLWATWLSLVETALIQVEQGVLPPEAMDRLGFAGSRGQWLTDSPTFRCVWPGLRVTAGASLRAYIEDGADPPECNDVAIPDWLRGG